MAVKANTNHKLRRKEKEYTQRTIQMIKKRISLSNKVNTKDNMSVSAELSILQETLMSVLKMLKDLL